jgi:outer membrane biosynthesis protein TonB
MSALTSNIRHSLCALALLLAAGALAGCETTSTGSPAPDVAAAKTPDPPMTREHAAELCWMGTEKSDARMDLDKRADIVDKCIADKLNGKKTAAVTPEKSKGKPSAEIKPKSDKPKAEITPKPRPKPEPKSEPKTDDSAEPKPKT